MKRIKGIVSCLAVFMLVFTSSSVDAAKHDKRKSVVLPEPIYEFDSPSVEKVDLGRLLMFDKILSGNRNISCATCHHSLTDTGDGLSLPVGEGGQGLGVTRLAWHEDDSIHERVPRNAPPVWNLGDRSFHSLFHDGRVSKLLAEMAGDYPSACKTPAGQDLPGNLDSLLACQAMFPVTSSTEMAGQYAEIQLRALQAWAICLWCGSFWHSV